MTGDVQDFINRIKSVLPDWFGENAALLEAFINGFATLDAFLYSVMQYVSAQMRIQTSTDENLDLEACDYFGDFVARFSGMPDDFFRTYILATLIEEMVTKQGMIKAMTNLTGHAPIILEPWDIANVGYNVPMWGYGVGGAYSSPLPYNFFITVFVDGNPMEGFGALNNPTWGYSVIGMGSNGAYGNESLYANTLTFDQVLAVVNRVKLGGTVPHLTVIYL